MNSNMITKAYEGWKIGYSNQPKCPHIGKKILMTEPGSLQGAGSSTTEDHHQVFTSGTTRRASLAEYSAQAGS